jgi:hypothetical protein
MRNKLALTALSRKLVAASEESLRCASVFPLEPGDRPLYNGAIFAAAPGVYAGSTSLSFEVFGRFAGSLTK